MVRCGHSRRVILLRARSEEPICGSAVLLPIRPSPGISDAAAQSKYHWELALGGTAKYLEVKSLGRYATWAFGAEVSFFDMVHLRAGRSIDVFLGTDCTTYGIGLGWDFGRVLVQLDYARIDPSCDACGFLGIRPEEDAFGLVVGGRF
jgi:hypothetical protein